jgi:PAS domain S-box-containing protein
MNRMGRPTGGALRFLGSSQGPAYAATVLFALAMLAMAWVWIHRESQAVENALSRDLQWAERTVHLRMESTLRGFFQLSHELANLSGGQDAFEERGAEYLAFTPEARSVRWYRDGESAPWEVRAEHEGPGRQLEEHRLPIMGPQGHAGTLVLSYSLEEMLRHALPEWFARTYRLAIMGPEGERGVLYSGPGPAQGGQGGVGQRISLGPLGEPLWLEARAFPSLLSLPGSFVAALVAVLSLLVVWSLWLLQGHVAHRVRVEKERDRLFNLSLDMLCILSLEGQFKRCNPAFERVTGHSVSFFLGKRLASLVHPDERKQTQEALKALSEGEARSFENRCLCANGEYTWLVWSANPVPDEGCIYAVAHDITGHKRAEEALRAESAFRRAMEESVITGLRAIDLSGRIIDVNSAFCRMVGFERDELIGCSPPFPYWPSDHQKNCEWLLAETLEGRSPKGGFEMRIQRKSGEMLDTRFYLSPLIDLSGQHTGWMASITDITEPKRIRAELEAAHRRFEAVLDGLEAAVFVADAHTDEILFANRAFKNAHEKERIGDSVCKTPMAPQEDPARRIDPRTVPPEALPCELFDGERHHSPSDRWYHVREHATRWVDGRIVRMGIATDITEHKRMHEMALQQEARVQKTARLITLGEMASTLAHELNQPLSAIANYCMGCVTRIQAGQRDEEALLSAMKKASAQAERAGKIIRHIREFVKKSTPERKAVMLSDIVENTLGFAEMDARRAQVQIDCVLPPDLPAVHADKIMIEQVLLNLVKNGIEAMQEVPVAQRRLRVVAIQKPSGREIEIHVEDQGHGVPPVLESQLFTPFYTTKPEGMGMGLNICRGIIEFHHGHLWMTPSPGGGSVFSFTLPTEPEHAPPSTKGLA